MRFSRLSTRRPLHSTLLPPVEESDDDQETSNSEHVMIMLGSSNTSGIQRMHGIQVEAWRAELKRFFMLHPIMFKGVEIGIIQPTENTVRFVLEHAKYDDPACAFVKSSLPKGCHLDFNSDDSTVGLVVTQEAQHNFAAWKKRGTLGMADWGCLEWLLVSAGCTMVTLGISMIFSSPHDHPHA